LVTDRIGVGGKEEERRGNTPNAAIGWGFQIYKKLSIKLLGRISTEGEKKRKCEERGWGGGNQKTTNLGGVSDSMWRIKSVLSFLNRMGGPEVGHKPLSQKGEKMGGSEGLLNVGDG